MAKRLIMDTEYGNSIKNIVWALRRIVNLIYRDSKEMNKRYGITGPQSLVIKCLYSANSPLSSATMSRSLCVTPANMTGIIDRLEQKGLVHRLKKQGDRRQTLIELSDKGKEYGEKLPDLIEAKLIEGLGNLNPTEIYGIYSAFSNIISIIEEKEIKDINFDLD
jgi:DNA-binding MarR family transcriptional regulator